MNCAETPDQLAAIDADHIPFRQLLSENCDRLPVPVAIGVGGSFDFAAGRVHRAPAWMRRIHLEWFFRLLLQPWRARRMAVLPLFTLRVLTSR